MGNLILFGNATLQFQEKQKPHPDAGTSAAAVIRAPALQLLLCESANVLAADKGNAYEHKADAQYNSMK